MLTADHDNEYTMIDGTVVRAHQHNAGARKETGPSIKIHVLSDASGDPRALMLTPGQDHVSACAELFSKMSTRAPSSLIRRMMPICLSTSSGTGEGRRSSRLKRIANIGANAISRSMARASHRAFFSQIRHFRGIATHYDKLARNYLAAVQLVAAVILLN